jgi:hypothetical protein
MQFRVLALQLLSNFLKKLPENYHRQEHQLGTAGEEGAAAIT